MMTAWGRFVGRRAAALLAAGVAVVTAAAVFGIGVFGALSDGGFDDPGSESARQLSAEQDNFASRNPDVVAIYSSESMTVDDQAFEQAVNDVTTRLPDAAVDRVVTFYDSAAAGLVSEDRQATSVIVTLAGTDQDAKAASYETVEPLLEADGLQTDLAGQSAVFSDVNDTVAEDIARAESVAMPIVFLLSLVIFGSFVAALMPALVGTVAVFGAFAVVRAITEVTEVSVFAINIITLIGMGLAIDYALFVVSRFREELARQPGTEREHVNAAVVRTMTTAGRTVLFSGLTVAASMASLLIFPQNFLRSMGYGGIAAVTVAMLAALTVLPALLAVLGRRIDLGRMPWRRGMRAELVTRERGGWAKVAHSVMARPMAYLVAIVAVLLVLGAPFVGAKWGSVDHRVLPGDAPARVATELQAERFGGETSTASIVVEGASGEQLSSYLRGLQQVDGVESVRPVDQTSQGGETGAPVTLVEVSWPGNGQSEASQQLVEDLRAVQPGGDATALVGGASAQAVDLIDSISSLLPWMGLFVVAVMLVLLFLAFGSLVLPVKAVLMNAVSIVASFGVVTWIFQDGNLSGLLGFESPGYLDVTQPILMLAILFGLSMDYEVFLLSRVREEWDRTHDNTAAVAAGLQRSGRIITSAALLLAVVIGGFATSGIVFMKMIGVGMLVAVLLDATVVRGLLVPATMRLLGDANWWSPGPLRRWWDSHGVHEEEAAPAQPVKALVGTTVGG